MMTEIHAKCSQCGKRHIFYSGHPPDEETLSQALKHFKGKTRLNIKGILQQHQIDRTLYGYALYVCPQCRILYNPYTIEIEYDNLLIFKPGHKCQHCYTTLQKTDPLQEGTATDKQSQYICEICGGTLQFQI